MINSYHPILIQILKCNMDIQPVTGETGIVKYIGKYISKFETSHIRPKIQEAKKFNIQVSARTKMLRISEKH